MLSESNTNLLGRMYGCVGKVNRGKNVTILGPCLECIDEVIFDLQMYRELQEKHPDLDYKWDIDYGEAILEELETNDYYCEMDSGCPSVVTKAKGIDRAEAERMLTFLLKKRFGIINPKFLWKKQDLCVTPMGFGNYAEA